MEQVDLWMICLVAFAAVFTLLAVLAILMRLAVALFPKKDAQTDAALYAAISTAYGSLYPGTQVTRIEELK